MSQQKYSRKIKLTAVEISDISMSLRKSVQDTKESLKKSRTEGESKAIKEYLEKIQKLQKRFQRLAVKIEKEVLKDIEGLE